MHPTQPKTGIRAERPDQVWHIDTTVFRLTDGTKLTSKASSTTSQASSRFESAHSSNPQPRRLSCSRPSIVPRIRPTIRSETPPALSSTGASRISTTLSTAWSTMAFCGDSLRKRLALQQFTDRGLLAKPQTWLVLSSFNRYHPDIASARRLLCRATQRQATACGIRWADTRRDVLRNWPTRPCPADRGCRQLVILTPDRPWKQRIRPTCDVLMS